MSTFKISFIDPPRDPFDRGISYFVIIWIFKKNPKGGGSPNLIYKMVLIKLNHLRFVFELISYKMQSKKIFTLLSKFSLKFDFESFQYNQIKKEAL